MKYLAKGIPAGYSASLGTGHQGADPNAVKITLNESIPEERRAQIETLVNITAGPSDIVWSHSRFPRLVIFVEPGPNDVAEPEGGSIFESPQAGRKSPATMVALLEERIKTALAGKA